MNMSNMDYKDFLKEKGAYAEWLDEFTKAYPEFANDAKLRDEYFPAQDPNAIEGAFLWAASPSGWDYWKKLDREWRELVGDYNG